MAVLKGFTFDGIKSVDYGVIVTGSNLYGAPERVIDMIEVPGRNGALALDQGRYSNVQVVYHCVMYDRDQADFARRIAGLRNELCSRHSYVRLENDWDADEYRLAMYREGLDADIVLERGGEFDLIFDCKPQRFLTSGEDTITVGDWGGATEYSGDVVSFEGDEMTAVKSLSVSLSPVQNLNGYDHPWVGGAGKNKYPILIGADTFTNNGGATHSNADGALKITCSATSTNEGVYGSSTSTFTVAVRETGFPCIVSFDIWSTGSAAVALRMFNNLKTLTVTATKQRVSIAIPTDATAGYFNCYANMFSGDIYIANMQIESGSTASPYEPYSNICPITGWDGVEVPIAGDNLLPMPITSGTYANGVTVTVNPDLSFTITKPTNSGWTSFALGTFTLKAGTYTLIEDDDASGNAGMELFNDDTGASITATRYVKRRVITLTETTRVRATFARSAAATDVLTKLMLFIGDTATAEAYEPYQGNTYTQEFEDELGNTLTVYGGESEIVGGVLKVTHGIIDLGTLQWGKYTQWGSDHTFLASLTFNGTGITTGVPPETFKSDAYKGITQAAALSGTDTGFWVRGDNQTLYFSDARYMDASAYKSAVGGLHLVYPLATPITYTLTPQQVETLIGTNNIWSDAGEVTVEIADDPNKIVNPTLYDAKPLIKVSGYGTVQVGSVTITIEGSASDVTYIDCDSMECYRLNGLAIVSANSAVSFSSYDFPVLEADAITGITYSTNISQVQIVPRWWQL